MKLHCSYSIVSGQARLVRVYTVIQCSACGVHFNSYGSFSNHYLRTDFPFTAWLSGFVRQWKISLKMFWLDPLPSDFHFCTYSSCSGLFYGCLTVSYLWVWILFIIYYSLGCQILICPNIQPGAYFCFNIDIFRLPSRWGILDLSFCSNGLNSKFDRLAQVNSYLSGLVERESQSFLRQLSQRLPRSRRQLCSAYSNPENWRFWRAHLWVLEEVSYPSPLTYFELFRYG